MIRTVCSYGAVMLLAAGLSPSIENPSRERFFSAWPLIALASLLVMALEAAHLRSATPEVQMTHRPSALAP
jgi:hypothetical protein